jgi:hypothetical protein
MHESRAALKPCQEPGRATVEDGFVLLDGPDGVAVTMTPDAAALTAESLHQAAMEARAANLPSTKSANSAQSADGNTAA